jgi:hypothetical protein
LRLSDARVTLFAVDEPLIYREESRRFSARSPTSTSKSCEFGGCSKMGKRKKIWRNDDERRAWERHAEEAIRNLRELAAGRAEREWREKHGKPAG